LFPKEEQVKNGFESTCKEKFVFLSSNLKDFKIINIFLILIKLGVIYEMFDPIKPTFPWKVLVLDEHSMKVLSSAMKLFDLTDENISGNIHFSFLLAHFESRYN